MFASFTSMLVSVVYRPFLTSFEVVAHNLTLASRSNTDVIKTKGLPVVSIGSAYCVYIRILLYASCGIGDTRVDVLALSVLKCRMT